MNYSVDVCIPAYNAEQYLEECLRSVQRQTVFKNVFLIDDGSFDRTLSIAKKYSLNHSSNQQNMGIGYTRAKLVEQSNSEYLAFISADDAYTHKKSLELMLEKADGDNAVYSNVWRCNAGLEPLDVVPSPEPTLDNFVSWALKSNMFINFSAVLIPRWIFRKAAFRHDLRKGEDLIFLLETLLNNLQWTNVELPLVKYRIHKAAGTNQWTTYEREQLWKYLFHLLRELGCPIVKTSVAYSTNRKQIKRSQYRSILPSPLIKILRKVRDL